MPDPLTVASTFATIVGLISNFRQEKGAIEALNHQKFVEWLDYHKHEDIKNLICNTAVLQDEVNNLLRADHGVIIEKLDAVNTTLASLMSQVSEFRGFVSAALPSAEFSEQAVSILKQFIESGSSYFSIIKMRAGPRLQLERSGQIIYQETEFLNDDLNRLVSVGLLSLDFGTSGDPYYRITRAGASFIRAITKPSS